MRGNLTTAPAFGATHIPQYPLELLAYHHPDSVHRLVSYSYYYWYLRYIIQRLEGGQ